MENWKIQEEKKLTYYNKNEILDLTIKKEQNMVTFILIFILGFGTKVAVDETDKYMTTKEIIECYEKTMSLKRCSPNQLKKGAVSNTFKYLNYQPQLWMYLAEDNELESVEEE